MADASDFVLSILLTFTKVPKNREAIYYLGEDATGTCTNYATDKVVMSSIKMNKVIINVSNKPPAWAADNQQTLTTVGERIAGCELNEKDKKTNGTSRTE